MAHWYNTPGHGWLVLTAAENRRIPAAFRNPYAEYEEDVGWTIPVLAIPELLDQPAFADVGGTPDCRAAMWAHAWEICRNYHPEAFAALTGEQPTPANSDALAERQFTAAHAHDWVVVAVFGAGLPGVPTGFVRGIATQGGRRDFGVARRDYLIRADKYSARHRFGYVIQPDDVRAEETAR